MDTDKPTGADRAWTLFMAGASFQQVAEVLDIEPDEVQELVDYAVNEVATARKSDAEPLEPDDLLELERLNSLWRVVYPKAVKGDLDAQSMCMRISGARKEVHRRTQHVAVPDPKDVPPAVSVRTAWQILAGGAPAVAQSLLDIAVHGKTESSRVTASVAVLDRSGISPVARSEVAVHLLDASLPEDNGGQLTASQVVRARLDAIRDRQLETVSKSYDYIDAED